MRYRPFGAAGKAVSAVSLLLREAPNMGSPAAWRSLIFAAMESGVNYFEVTAGAQVLALGVGEALRAVERRLVFVGWRIENLSQTGAITARDIAASVREGLSKTRTGYFDLLTIDEGAADALTPEALKYLADLRTGGACLQIGVAGDGPGIEACIASGVYDVLTTSFSLTSDWQARRRIRDASAANMTLVCCNPIPGDLRGPRPTRPEPELSARRGLLGRRPADPLRAKVGSYGFLQDTPGWTEEELCLAYALTEPSFASIQVEARASNIERLAAVPDRDLPTGVAAQIELARFGQLPVERRA